VILKTKIQIMIIDNDSRYILLMRNHFCKRVFLDHFLRVNDKKGANNLYVSHQFNYENKFLNTIKQRCPPTVGSRLLDLEIPM
jgi:hypothetical protein